MRKLRELNHEFFVTYFGKTATDSAEHSHGAGGEHAGHTHE